MSKLLIAVWIVAGGILVFLLFVPPVVGLADQGDYGRITSAFRIQYPPDLPKADRYFCYIQTKYLITRGRKPGSARVPYFSSELLFVGAAVALHSILFNPSTFDIRALGAVHSVAFLGALGLAVYSGSFLSRTPKAVLAALSLFIFGDIGYLSYFNSFFSEPASFVFGLAYIGSALLLVRSCRRTLWHLSFVTISASLFIAAKSQNVPLAAVIAGFLWFCIRPLQTSVRLWNAACIASGCLILAVAATSYSRASDTKNVGLYGFIFNELLTRSPNPDADLRELELSPQLAHYIGTHSWNPEAYHSSELFPGKVNLVRVLGFYLMRPSRLFDLIQRGAADSLSNRCPDIGNFERASGKPCRTISNSFSAWDRIRSHFKSVWILALFFAANVVVPLRASKSRDEKLRVLLQLHATLAIMAVLSFLTAVFGDSNDTQKHLFLFNFLFDCCLIGDLQWLWPRLSRSSNHAKAQEGAAALAAAT